ncbi:hypothetical protein Vretimale_7295 [Volvox reticuliferus]|nr:hypothetical protein Vretimale_7295 [Volvox reticuliferus]
MPELLEEVLERLADFKVFPDRFEFVREGLVREYANQLHNQPYSWAMYRAEMLTTARRWPIEVYGSEAASVTAEELQVFVRHRLCSRCFVEGLGAGNLRRREVLHCAALLLTCLRDKCGAAPLHPAERAELRMLEVPPTPLPRAAVTAAPPAAAASAAAAAAVAASREVTADAAESSSGVSAVAVGQDDGAGGQAANRDAAAVAAAIVAKAADVEGKGREEGKGEEAIAAISGGWLFLEDVPNSQDDNSAALVMYQVGPDDLRRNALRSLFVHLAKRDAFSELRTRQQLGYIVSLHGGSEHGVGYVEMLVQSNAYDAVELCHRLDDFMLWFLETGLPEKCGVTAATTAAITTTAAAAAASPASSPANSGSTSGGHGTDKAAARDADEADGPTASGGENEMQTSAAAAASSSGGSGTGDGGADTADAPTRIAAVASVPATSGTRTFNPTQFEIAVEELAKSKLEAPKKLGDLANRWWSEVHKGYYCFDRQAPEVAELRSLTPGELLSFARELLIGSPIRAAATPLPVPVSPLTPPLITSAVEHIGCGTYHTKRLSVQIRGKGEATRAAAAAGAATVAAVAAAAAATATTGLVQQQQQSAAGATLPSESKSKEDNTTGANRASAPSRGGTLRHRRPYSRIPEKDPFSWKRSCALLPSVQALWVARRAAAAATAAAGFRGTGVDDEVLPGVSVAEDELEQVMKSRP